MTAAGERLDRNVRLAIFDRLLGTRRAPSAGELAREFGVLPEEAVESCRRLAEQHRLVLRPGTDEILMANPLSAVPTAFTVEVEGKSHFGNCIWDALGVIAMLGDSGRVLTSCGDGCGEAMTVTIEHDVPVDPRGIIHFQVPRARWWEDIVFT